MATAEYRVQLDIFSGPLDLLLYLVRRDEVDVEDVPISRVTEQYLEYVRLIESLDPDAAGEFLVMASTLLELKSRAVLPSPPIEPLDDADDPRAALVRQLLDYKRFKDAARALGSSADERRQRYVRKPADLPVELQGVDLEEAQVWDLLAAFGRVMTAIGRGPGLHEIRYDEHPIAFYAERILKRIDREGPTRFGNLFEGAADRGEFTGVFLALLELVRRSRVRCEQALLHGEIFVFALEGVDEALDAEDFERGFTYQRMVGDDEPEEAQGDAPEAPAPEGDAAAPPRPTVVLYADDVAEEDVPSAHSGPHETEERREQAE